MQFGQIIATTRPQEQAVQGFQPNRSYTKAEADNRFAPIGPIPGGYVPYIGATTNVDLGGNSLSASALYATGLTQNSVIFVGATGALSQDNSNFNYIAATGFHVGNAPGTTNANVGGYGLELSGSNNTTGGVNLIVSNTSNGTSAFSDIFFQNDLANSSGAHFAVLNYSSSTYSDSTFGTILAQPNQLALYGIDGNTLIGSAAASGYVGIFTGGTSTTNERARFTNTQLLLRVQESWATGLGSITHILGPSDNAFNINSANAVAVTTAVAGNNLNFTAGNATAGSTVSSAAAGGSMSFVTGNAANNTSASARGGDWSVLTGTGIGGAGSGNISLTTGIAGGTGNIGSVTIKTGDGTAGTNNAGGPITIQTGATNATAGAINIIGGTPQINGSATSKGGLLNFISGAGVQKTGGLSGDGGTATFGTGAGGLSPITGAGATGIGANAGLLSLLGGAGGAATGAGAGGTFTGGNGASINITPGAGGNASGASGTRIGGNSGSLNFAISAVGTGATANGTLGTFNFTGSKAIFAATTTSYASINLPSGSAPSAPANGDMWYDGTHLQARLSGATYQLDQQTVLSYPHGIFTPTTGQTITTVKNQYNIVNPAGALLALTVNLPSTPANNDVVYIKFTQAITTVTYVNGTVVDGITSPVAGGLVIFVYDSGTTSWY